MKFIKTASRIIDVEKIPYAMIHHNQAVIFPVDYHLVALTGEDALRVREAMREVGFVGDGTLINPARISVVEDAGSTMKVFLEGSDRVVTITPQIAAKLFPAPETPSSEGTPVEKPRRKKAGERGSE